VDPDSLDQYPDPGEQKRPRKEVINLIFLSARCPLVRAEAFSCSLDISKLQFLTKTIFKNFSAVFFSSDFGYKNTGSGLDPEPYLDPNWIRIHIWIRIHLKC
jgi:hypothetical protein